MTENIIAWRMTPIEGVCRGFTDDPNVAEKWRKAGCIVEPLVLVTGHPRHHLDASKWPSKADMEAAHAQLSAETSEDGLARCATEWADSFGFYDPREAEDLAEKVIKETPIVARLMPVHSHSSAETDDGDDEFRACQLHWPEPYGSTIGRAADEIDRLRHDIERYIQIATDEAELAEFYANSHPVNEPQSVPQPTLVVGPNTTGGDENFAPASGLNYSAARLLLWFKSWDEAVQFNASLTRKKGAA